MRLRSILITCAVGVALVPAVIVGVDAIVRWSPRSSTIAAQVDRAADLDAYLAAREDSIAGVKPTAHGLVNGEAFRVVSPQQWIDDAREALAIGKRRVPLLTLYTHTDDVVRVDLIRTRHAAFGSHVKRTIDVPEATHHVLAGDAMGPRATDPIVASILAFLREAGTVTRASADGIQPPLRPPALRR